jgi:hypothetical protein
VIKELLIWLVFNKDINSFRFKIGFYGLDTYLNSKNIFLFKWLFFLFFHGVNLSLYASEVLGVIYVDFNNPN